TVTGRQSSLQPEATDAIINRRKPSQTYRRTRRTQCSTRGSERSLGKSYRALARSERTRARRNPDDAEAWQFLTIENSLVIELADVLSSQRKALALVGLARSVWHYRVNPRPRLSDPIEQKQREYS